MKLGSSALGLLLMQAAKGAAAVPLNRQKGKALRQQDHLGVPRRADQVTPTTKVFSSGDISILIPTSVSQKLVEPSPTITVDFGQPCFIQDVNVHFNDLLHDFVGDLSVALVSPLRSMVVLMTSAGGNAVNLINTRIDDQAASEITFGENLDDGSFKPTVGPKTRDNFLIGLLTPAPLSAFNGENANGIWTLQIFDNSPSFDDGELTGWELEITCATAEDSSSEEELDTGNDRRE